MLNGKAGANVNSNVGTQKSTEKVATAALGGLLRSTWAVRLLPIDVKLLDEVFRSSSQNINNLNKLGISLQFM